GIAMLCIFGVFAIIMILWQRTIIKKIKLISGEEPKCAGELLLCLFIPFYIYYWVFTRARKLSAAAANHNVHIKDHGALYLVLTIFALQLIALILLHINCNKAEKMIAEAQQAGQRNVPNRLNPEFYAPAPISNNNNRQQRVESPMTDLIGLAKLKVEGKITLEEYDNRREEVLAKL
ncbi:MAG: hypothetical protein GX824_06730, partial [Clostridiales bacterium]|nr:hypothetical protein [Clostridiales bacterium]